MILCGATERRILFSVFTKVSNASCSVISFLDILIDHFTKHIYKAN